MHESVKSETRTIRPGGESIRKFVNPLSIVVHLNGFRGLIFQLTKRQVIARYKGSVLGLGWSFIQPLLMLGVYTFVFSVIFKARWGIQGGGSRIEYALALFTGLITYGIFAEAVNAAPSLVIANGNFVKKVVFPVEILPLTNVLSALVNSVFGVSVLLIALLGFRGSIHWTVIFLPLVWFPMIFFTMGFVYFMAAIGVFIRDVEASVGIFTTILFFLTPVFYPASAVPERFRFVCRMNPFANFVESTRDILLWGAFPSWSGFLFWSFVSLVVFVLGFLWFMKSKNAFPDVM